MQRSKHHTADGQPRPNAPEYDQSLDQPENWPALDDAAIIRLQQTLAQLDKLKNERKQSSEKITDAMKDAVSDGFDRTTLQFVMRIRGMEPAQRKYFLAAIDVYCSKLNLY